MFIAGEARLSAEVQRKQSNLFGTVAAETQARMFSGIGADRLEQAKAS
jgi:hypothetical protein